MAVEVILPRVDMDMTTGLIARWLVADGAAVEKGQPIFEIETDKAAMEIDAPAAGVLRTLAPTGEAIPVGTAVAAILAPGEDVPTRAIAAAGSAPPEPPAAPPAAPSAAAEPAPAVVDPAKGVRATPLARRLARAAGIELAGLRGTGPRGRIQADDVRAATIAAGAVRGGAAPGPLVTLRDGAGPPVVLVHGFGADRDAWRPFVQARAIGRRLVALDLPGHGDAAALAEPSFAALVDHLVQRLGDALAEPFDLVGHSLGAALATGVADSGSLPVRSLFLIAPAGLGPEIHHGFLDGFCRARSEAAVAAWMRLLVEDEAALSAAFVRRTAQARADGRLGEAQARLAQALFPEGAQAFDIRAALRRFPGPVSVVHGSADRIIPVRHTDGLPGEVALHRLAATGHLPQIERGALVAVILERHLRQAD
jgi:pyruvate dehydrogenase E2 component (dihydrolipoamide acetyltransferase)